MALTELLTSVSKKILGTTNEKMVKVYRPFVAKVNALEPQMQQADDGELRTIAAGLLKRVREDDASLDEVQVEAFALVREVADRQLGMLNAVLEREPGFDDEWFGDQLATVTAMRERVAGEDAPKSWDLDLPASVYAKIRDRFPLSVPPFRMRAHEVQVVGGAVLHEGKIAELKTGEGKTLVAVFACYLNALNGKGVHVITVNDYLARRDGAWNEPILRFLGMRVGAIQSEMVPSERKEVYGYDVTYGTNNEFGFDYLRDNLKQHLEDQAQTRRDFAIVDEVDSVLIDEARTPLIISGPAQGREEFYQLADQVARQLKVDEHFEVDIKDRTVTLTEEGIERATQLFGLDSLYDAEGMHLPHYLDNALKAHHLYHKDKEYLIVGGDIKIVDEFTGRVLAGRRWSEGLHQAVEAKEGVKVQPETQTYATITLQNFFRLYGKLAGMTGTAMTEANEFSSIYKLSPISVPTNRPIVRNDLADLIYGSEPEKFDAIAKEVEELHGIGQPILVGTVSVETSERLSETLKRRGVKHNVLNARHNQHEAEVVANAGQLGAVTIATNMAGRGTDIKLGRVSFDNLLKHWRSCGTAPKRIQAQDSNIDEAVVDLWAKRFLGDDEAGKLRGNTEGQLAAINKHRREMGWHPLPMPTSLREGADVRGLGGLRIIGTERHESRRIDNQLRGRSGRQGDPGSSRFYLSLDDELMKRFAGPTMANMMRSMGLKDGVPIESKMVSRAVEKAQKRVEEYNFGIRKNLLEYDEVMNLQRKQIYVQRQRILEGEGLEETFYELYGHALDEVVQKSAADGIRGDELAKRLAADFLENTGVEPPAESDIPVKQGGDACRDFLLGLVRERFELRRKEFGEEVLAQVLRLVMLETIDRRWKDHIDFMDGLRRSIGLESYGQKDPKLRFKEEGFRRYENMMELIQLDVARIFFRLQIVNDQQQAPNKPGVPGMLEAGGFAPKPIGVASKANATTQKMDAQKMDAQLNSKTNTSMQPQPDDPCPCGSGGLYKDCHGKL
ncbi:MAG: preprotein translocase subunit SecA [Planctomycetota bacterium]|jgi:preprotein translocase subunit SecA|nr:preprotein translocase subunit SecA [Planctomycetota bacterium]